MVAVMHSLMWSLAGFLATWINLSSATVSKEEFIVKLDDSIRDDPDLTADDEEEYAEFLEKFDKLEAYLEGPFEGDFDEFLRRRYRAYEENKATIARLNARATREDEEYAMNSLGDLTLEEMQDFDDRGDSLRRRMGWKEDCIQIPTASLPTDAADRTDIDLLESCGKVKTRRSAGIKDRIYDPPGWAFAATGQLQCNYNDQTGASAVFSEKYLMDCSDDAVKETTGAATPWYDDNGACTSFSGNCDCKEPRKFGQCYAVDGADFDVVAAAATEHAYAFTIWICDSWRFAKSTWYGCGDDEKLKSEHAMVIVGQENGEKVLVRNSWGKGWGLETAGFEGHLWFHKDVWSSKSVTTFADEGRNFPLTRTDFGDASSLAIMDPQKPQKGNLVGQISIGHTMHFEMDVQINSFPRGTGQIFRCGDSSVSMPSISISKFKDRGFRVEWNDGDADRIFDDTMTPLVTDKWYHLELDVSRTTIQVTVDDVVRFSESKERNLMLNDIECYLSDPFGKDAADVQVKGLQFGPPALVRAEGGIVPSEGQYFVPEVFFEDHYYPICGTGFWDNNHGASTICKDLGFSSGELRKTNAVYEQYAMPVGSCQPGEALDRCSGGGNAFGDSSESSCTKGKPIGVEVRCLHPAFCSVSQVVWSEALEEYQDMIFQDCGASSRDRILSHSKKTPIVSTDHEVRFRYSQIARYLVPLVDSGMPTDDSFMGGFDYPLFMDILTPFIDDLAILDDSWSYSNGVTIAVTASRDFYKKDDPAVCYMGVAFEFVTFDTVNVYGYKGVCPEKAAMNKMAGTGDDTGDLYGGIHVYRRVEDIDGVVWAMDLGESGVFAFDDQCQVNSMSLLEGNGQMGPDYGKNFNYDDKYPAEYGMCFNYDRTLLQSGVVVRGPHSLCDEEPLTDGAWYSPLDLPGHPRTVATVSRCRERCLMVPECYFFNNFPNGGCHLSGKDAKLDYSQKKSNPTRAAGQIRCKDDNSAESCNTNTLHDGAWYSPLDLPGHPRTEDTFQGCRQRCEDVAECYFFNNFPNGGCHLSGKDAKLDYSQQKRNPTTAAGRVRCEEGGPCKSEDTLREDPGKANQKCGNPGDKGRVFDFREGDATLENCKSACLCNDECVAFSMVEGEWCIGCDRELDTQHSSECVAYTLNEPTNPDYPVYTECGCELMTKKGWHYEEKKGSTGKAKGAYCQSDQDKWARCCCNGGFGCQANTDRCVYPASAAAVSAIEQRDEPAQLPALIALHSAHAVSGDLDGSLDGSYCCQARTVDGWNGNWNGVCWGAQTEADCNSNGRKCEWTPDDCRPELDCLLLDEECGSDEDCCSGRCRVDEKLCR